jgi:hypothetical protein
LDRRWYVAPAPEFLTKRFRDQLRIFLTYQRTITLMIQNQIESAGPKVCLASPDTTPVHWTSSPRRSSPLLIWGTVTALALILSGSGQVNAGPITFDFQFTSFYSEPGGTGTFTIANDPGVGTFVLDTLGSFTMFYSIDGGTATDADILSDPSRTTVVISSVGPGQESLYFSDTGGGAGGPFGGSLDLLSSSLLLSFSPSNFGPGYFGSDTPLESDFGSYTALSVPEPASIVQLGLGASCLAGIITWRRKRRTAA